VSVDWLVIGFTAMMALFVVPVFVALWIFIWRYRRGRKAAHDHRARSNLPLELAWIVLPFIGSLVIFGFAARFFSSRVRRRPMRWKCRSRPGSGCGNSSIKVDSARSTPCTYRRGAR
jgi:heme/copper-type cytochrome/quinol oxidase subunit 2